MSASPAAESVASNDDLTAAIVELVGRDGLVEIERPVAEFERTLHLTPREPRAVSLQVMMGHEEEQVMPGSEGLVVVSARKPSLAWWTLDDATHGDGHLAAWKIIQLIVDRGGAIDTRQDRLFDADGTVVYGSTQTPRKRPRYLTFPPYRSLERT